MHASSKGKTCKIDFTVFVFVFQLYLTHVWFCMMLFHSQGQEILSQVSQTICDESDEDDHQNVRNTCLSVL